MQIESKYLNYSVGAITFEAYCAYQPSRQKQPAVLVAPAWAGRGDFVCQKAKMLAEMGYVGITAIELRIITKKHVFFFAFDNCKR